MSHTHQPYPQFSVDCFKDLVRIARGKTVKEELPLFAKCVYTIEGAALGATIGEPPGTETFAGDALTCSDDEKKEALAVLEGMSEDGVYAAGESAINPFVLALIEQGIKALLAWLSKT